MSSIEANAVGRPCRGCGAPVFNQLDAHPCCVKFRADLETRRPCPACKTSRGAAHRNHEDVPWGGPPAHGYPLKDEVSDASA